MNMNRMDIKDVQHIVNDAYIKVLAFARADTRSYPDINDPYPNTIDRHMAKLLGFKVEDAHTALKQPEIQDKLNSLAGPHGYTIYKAMLARLDDGKEG